MKRQSGWRREDKVYCVLTDLVKFLFVQNSFVVRNRLHNFLAIQMKNVGVQEEDCQIGHMLGTMHVYLDHGLKLAQCSM